MYKMASRLLFLVSLAAITATKGKLLTFTYTLRLLCNNVLSTVSFMEQSETVDINTLLRIPTITYTATSLAERCSVR